MLSTNYTDVHMVWIIKIYLKTKEVQFKKKSDTKSYGNKHKNYVNATLIKGINFNALSICLIISACIFIFL